MTREEIIALAVHCGAEFRCETILVNGKDADDFVIAFATLVAEREREACAKLAEITVCDTHIPTGINIYGSRVAKAIRSRNEQC